MLSALPKLRHPTSFIATVRSYRLLPEKGNPPGAAILLTVIVILALSLLAGVALDVAVPTALASLAAFALAVGINVRRGSSIECGCFGESGDPISARTLVRLLALFSLGLGELGFRIVSASWPPSTLDLALSHPGYLAVTMTEAFFLLVAGAWMLASPEAVDVLRVLWPRTAHRGR